MITELMDSIQRVYPGDQILYNFKNQHFVLFKRLDNFQDNLSALRRYRLITAGQQVMSAHATAEGVVQALMEVGLTEDEIRQVVEAQARETCMLVHLKVHAMNEHMDKALIDQGKIQYDNLTQSFDSADNKLEWLLDYSNNSTPTPALSVVEDTDET